MPRDRWLLELLNEHQVFTTEHVAALGFDHVHTARNRLVLPDGFGGVAVLQPPGHSDDDT
ncbi:hypothetical protein [Phytohabitans aurantiacus]|uniref:Uncharacterized protein n=1 Tax=Phytohabitans aurantiacus TaxID=3016789 RepID=A0ABQ5R846_9ACTN|nr:hypothetical protein [Phytohabitans aurantiacus]GLI02939.1 hypothetical protein Pa4123_82170 [Phytohabitans aurantiacus]